MSSLKILKKAYDALDNDHIRSILLGTAERFHFPKDIVRLDTNGYCNIHCIMCSQVRSCEKKQFMSLDQFRSIIDMFAPTTRMLYLSCAYEPLITPHFTEYLKYARSKRIPQISFCTNALLMNDEIISCLVDHQIDEVIISFNGFCEEDYNRIMKGSDFHRVCANIKALVEYKKIKNTVKPHIRLNTILLKSNLLNFESMFQFLLENDIDTIQFRELMLLEGQNDPQEVKKELISNISPEEYKQITSKIKDTARQLHSIGKEVILPAAFGEDIGEKLAENSSNESKSEISIQKNNIKKQSCSIPCFSYWIDRDGGVRVCGYDDNGIIGNALQQDMRALKEKRKEFQRLALAGECSSELCSINIDSSTVL